MATIRMVADRAGVSEATVSRVLNGTAGVREETRKKVEEAVRELDFVPNAVARGLRSGRTGIIGLVVPDVSSMFFLDIIKGLENTLTLHDYKIVICDSQNQVQLEKENTNWLLRGGVDGLVMLVPRMDDAALMEAAGSDIPIALFGRELEHPNISWVTVDNVYGSRVATQHLISHGHQRIGLIDGAIVNPPDVARRGEGYRQALLLAGLPFNPELTVYGDLNEDGGARALRSLMDRPEPPTAVFCANDEMAFGALQAAAELGLSVPKDLAIVGFDNVRLSRMVMPSLTTINQPRAEAGFRLAGNLLNRLTGRAGTERITLPCDLVVRRSCGC